MTEKEIEDLKKTFYEQLKRRDEEIDRLKKENKLLLATALKQSKRNEEISKHVDRISRNQNHNQYK